MKNHTDVLIFHTSICAGASQIDPDGRREFEIRVAPSRKRSGMEIFMNELSKYENTDIMDAYQKSENILTDVQNIIETSQRQAYHAVDTILSQRNWLIGCRIAEEEMDGAERAEYGTNIIKQLSKELTAKYGRGYDRSNLYHCLRFYKEFPEIVDTVCRQSNIRCAQHGRNLMGESP